MPQFWLRQIPGESSSASRQGQNRTPTRHRHHSKHETISETVCKNIPKHFNTYSQGGLEYWKKVLEMGEQEVNGNISDDRYCEQLPNTSSAQILKQLRPRGILKNQKQPTLIIKTLKSSIKFCALTPFLARVATSRATALPTVFSGSTIRA